MRTKTVTLISSFGYNIIRCSAVPLAWQHLLCPNYKISPVEDANGNLLQISPAATQRSRFVIAVYKTIFLVADYFSVYVLIENRFLNRHFHSISCIDLQVDFVKAKLRIFGSAINKFTIK